MPDSEVQRIYKTQLADGKTPKDAAKIAQKKTGFSVVTDRPIKAKGLKFTKEGVTYGQNTTLRKAGSKERQGVPSQFG
jgi:hypothetical protein